MKFLTGLCQDDVTTSSDDVISRKQLRSHVREKILGKVTKGNLKIGYGSGVTQQKVGLGVNLPPLVLCVLKVFFADLEETTSDVFFQKNICIRYIMYYDSKMINIGHKLQISRTYDSKSLSIYRFTFI